MQNRDVLVHLYLSVQIGIGMVPSFLAVAVKHSDLKALRRKGFSCLQFQVSHQAERSGQELKAGTCSRTTEKAALQLIHSGLLNWLSPTAQAHRTKDGAAYSGSGPVASVTIQTVVHRHACRSVGSRQFLSWDSLLSWLQAMSGGHLKLSRMTFFL